MKKILKVGLGGDLLACLAAAAEREQVAEAELVRRALWLYFGTPEGARRCEALPGPDPGPGPAAGAGSPPFSPRLSPQPPSVSPPLPAQQAPLPDVADDVVLTFPCIRHPRSGDRAGDLAWALTRRQLARWEEVFPDMDVLGEMRKAQEYLALRPERRKTARGMPKCLFGWLARGQDSGRYLRRTGPSAAGAPGRSGGAGAASARTRFDEYGFESWEQWEAKLRETLSGDTLDQALRTLGELRRRWGEERRRA